MLLRASLRVEIIEKQIFLKVRREFLIGISNHQWSVSGDNGFPVKEIIQDHVKEIR